MRPRRLISAHYAERNDWPSAMDIVFAEADPPVWSPFSFLRRYLNYLLRFSSHAVLPISSRGRPVVRTNIRFTDRTANARLAGHSIRPACVDFRADWHGQNTRGVSPFSGCIVLTGRGKSFA